MPPPTNLRMPLPVLLVILFSEIVLGQNFTVPYTWREPNSTLARTERLNIARDAVQSMITNINPSNGTDPALTAWQSANLLGSIAQFDYISASQTYHGFLNDSIMAFHDGHATFFDSQVANITSDPLMWGLAACYSSRAYNDTGMLDVAVQVWDVAQTYLVSEEDGAAGTQQTRNGSFTAHCDPSSNATSAGAVFSQASISSDYTSNADTVGAYVALSAHLFAVTGNTTYLASAERSALFMYNHMYSPDLKIVWNSFNLQTCKTNELQWTHNQGFLLEGLSILSTAPLATSSTFKSLMQTLVSSTIPCPAWTIPKGDTAGVLNETSPSAQPGENDVALTYRDVYMRALYEVWSRTSPSEPMALFIESYMTVQYNALLELASNHGGNFSFDWTGPQASQKLDWGQSASLDVLSATIGMASIKSAVAAPHHRSLSGGAIAGIVIGIVAGSVLVIAGVLLARRRKAHMRKPDSEPILLDPFPSGLPTSEMEDGMELPAGYAFKDRHGFGPARLVPRSSSGQLTRRSGPDPSVQPPTTASSDEPGTPVDVNETSVTRLIHQILSVMQTHEAPPAYAGLQVPSGER
ncbi:hypothetical protein PENSPDRAFT_749801 [Peniophora sp. CONT]|nr:hypothetical protein PENSPDRAFT_749801 [Peniophora sp. CONT]